jgi:hypothetical protein
MIFTAPNFILLSAKDHESPPENKVQILIFNNPQCSHSWVFTKMISVEVVHPLKIYQHTKCNVLTLTGSSFVSISKFVTCHFGMVKATR